MYNIAVYAYTNVHMCKITTGKDIQSYRDDINTRILTLYNI